jgi:hypothetical protein
VRSAVSTRPTSSADCCASRCAVPPGDVTFGEETEDVLVEVFGGISLALARSFHVVDPQVRNPSTDHWDRTFDLFRLLL